MVLGNETGFHHILCFIKSVEGLPASLEKAYFNWQSRKEESSWKTREDSVTPFLCMRTKIKSRPSLICATERKGKRVALQAPCRIVIPKISSEELNNCKTPFWTWHGKMFLIWSVSFLEQTQVTTSFTTRDMRHCSCEDQLFVEVHNINTGYESNGLLACQGFFFSVWTLYKD